MATSEIAKLALEDGTVFTGRAFGARGEVDGEVVFNTSMTGYQEILTDPSYHGQIVAMTYPMIGNYGVNAEDAESARPWVRAFVVRELSRLASNHRSGGTLDAYLAEHGVLGIEGIDTRALVRLTRERGALKGIVSTDRTRRRPPRRQGQGQPRPGRPRPHARGHGENPRRLGARVHRRVRQGGPGASSKPGEDRPHVVALDFGMKWNIPRHLVESGCRVTVVPGSTPAPAILDHRPDGIFLSNGPGDPAALDGTTVDRPDLDQGRGRVARHPDLRDLPGASASRPGVRRPDVQAQVRPPGGEPPGPRRADGQGRDHHPEPRLRRRPGQRSRPTSSPATSTSTIRPSKGSATPACPSPASSITPRRPPAPTTAATSSPSSAARSAEGMMRLVLRGPV